MGLAQRKDKQRIGYDPRNLTWSNDTDRFSYKHMTALGWDTSKGMGRDGGGNPNHIAVIRKADNGGIGMGRAIKEGQDLSAGAGQAGAGLADVLSRLARNKAASAAASAATTPAESETASPAPESAPASPAALALRNKMASRQRHLNSKRMASQSPAALAEILGVPVSSLPASPAPATPVVSAPTSGTSTPATAKAKSPEPTSVITSGTETITRDSTEADGVTKSTMSVAEYFRMKLREKALKRQAASGSTTPLPEMAADSLAVMKEEKNVAIGGVAWEGSKMAFEETTTTIVELGGDDGPVTATETTTVEIVEGKKSKKEKKSKKDDTPEAGPSTPSAAVDEKAAKKARKEAKKAAKLAAESSAAATPVDSPSTPAAGDVTPALSEKEEKRRRKEDKKARKAESAGSSDDAKKEKKEKKRKREDDGEEKRSKSKSK